MRLIGTLFGKIGEWSNKYANLPDRYIDRITERVCIFVLYTCLSLFIILYIHFI